MHSGSYEDNIKHYIMRNYSTVLELLRTLCHIPAPSNHEHDRAEFCKKWLEGCGAQGVYIDGAQNVIYPFHCNGSNEITVLAAHTDTVFPDLHPMPYREDDEKIYCPGVGDDTASLAVLLMTAKYFIENQIVPRNGILFVCNSAEEGLGNLRGTRQLMNDYGDRVAQFITFDSNLNIMNTECVGSHRYRVEVRTIGGHSYQEFGKTNAIAVLSDIVSRIYAIEVPQIQDSRTTYNVGIIQGGTSVNTIAQNATMLCEYRSDNEKALRIMQEKFDEILKKSQEEGIDVLVEKIGDRPCAGEVDKDKLNDLFRLCRETIEDGINGKVICKSASTDCNIPLSMGIPSVCIGVYHGGGSHTREEWILKESLKQGMEIAIRIGLAL